MDAVKAKLASLRAFALVDAAEALLPLLAVSSPPALSALTPIPGHALLPTSSNIPAAAHPAHLASPSLVVASRAQVLHQVQVLAGLLLRAEGAAGPVGSDEQQQAAGVGAGRQQQAAVAGGACDLPPDLRTRAERALQALCSQAAQLPHEDTADTSGTASAAVAARRAGTAAHPSAAAEALGQAARESESSACGAGSSALQLHWGQLAQVQLAVCMLSGARKLAAAQLGGGSVHSRLGLLVAKLPVLHTLIKSVKPELLAAAFAAAPPPAATPLLPTGLRPPPSAQLQTGTSSQAWLQSVLVQLLQALHAEVLSFLHRLHSTLPLPPQPASLDAQTAMQSMRELLAKGHQRKQGSVGTPSTPATSAASGQEAGAGVGVGGDAGVRVSATLATLAKAHTTLEQGCWLLLHLERCQKVLLQSGTHTLGPAQGTRLETALPGLNGFRGGPQQLTPTLGPGGVMGGGRPLTLTPGPSGFATGGRQLLLPRSGMQTPSRLAFLPQRTAGAVPMGGLGDLHTPGIRHAGAGSMPGTTPGVGLAGAGGAGVGNTTPAQLDALIVTQVQCSEASLYGGDYWYVRKVYSIG